MIKSHPVACPRPSHPSLVGTRKRNRSAGEKEPWRSPCEFICTPSVLVPVTTLKVSPHSSFGVPIVTPRRNAWGPGVSSAAEGVGE